MAHTPLTFEEHCEIAQTLTETRNSLLHWMNENMFGNYPKTGPKAKFQNALLGVVSALDKAKSEGENQLAVEHRDQFDVHVYYPSSRT